MTIQRMTSLQRVLTTLGHQEPDRVPNMLLLALQGAIELGLPIRSYFSKAENVAVAQVRLRKKYHTDCLYGFYYASLETEAFGGETIFIEDGPPNAGQPIVKKTEDVLNLEPPRIRDCAGLQKVLTTHRLLKEQVKDEAPIIGVVMSPFSLPVMQMGFEMYINLLYEHPVLVDRLMQVNEEFCVAWANAQLESGATAICYFDPISSPTIVPPELYRKVGKPAAVRTLARIKGPTATHFASGRCLAIMDDVCATGTAMIGVSVDEDLALLKQAAAGRVSLIGNLNGVEMRRWSQQQAEAAVKKAIASAGRGGGYLLSDNHGEIPFQVPADVIGSISEAVLTWGNYPLAWVEEHV